MSEGTTLPAGTLTLLFSDIEGATLLLTELGTRYSEVLSLQRRILRRAFDRWGGQEVSSEGGRFFVVFPSATAALDAAAEAQREIAAASWPTEGVRVRMGLHTGEPVRHEDGYVGTDVHRAARVAAVAHGGQVLLTAATQRLAGGRRDLGFVPLGRHRLKDVPGPEELFQLTAEGLERDFPPPRTVGSVSMLPEPATALVGRGDELADVTEQVLGPPGTVVSVVGPAGVGKTRLALAAAAAVRGEFPDGVYFVHVSAARAPEMVRSAVADALAIGGEDRTPAGLLQFLAGMRALVLIDSVPPGVADAVADVVARLAAAGPGVRVLVTAREPLGLPGEHVRPLGPLEVPEPGAAADAVAATGAVQLFLQSARQAAPELHVGPEALEEVAAVVRLLGGVPLAVELAGARAVRLRPADLRERLERALVGDPAAVLPAVIGMSYELLAPEVRRTFRHLSVFEGWFDLPAAVAVVAHAEDGLEVLEHVGELLQAGLITVRDSPDGEPRLRMLRPLADHGSRLLAEAGEEAAVRRRHAEHYLALVEEVTEQLRTAGHLSARDRLEVALDNTRAALAWAFGPETGRPGNVALGLRLCAALSWFWFSVGYPTESRRWLEIALRSAVDHETPEVVRALHALGVILHQHGEAERAVAVLERCLEYWRGAGERRGVALALNTLALSRRALGDADGAARLLAEAVEAARELGDRSVLADILSNLAALEIDGGRYEAAIARLEEVLTIDTAIDDRWGIAADHVNLASTLLRAGRDDEAERMLDEHAAGAVALGDIELTADLVEIYCVLHAMRGDVRRAATLLGVAEGLRERAELPMSEPDRRWLERTLAAARERVDPATWAQWVRAGRRLTPEEALVEAQRRP